MHACVKLIKVTSDFAELRFGWLYLWLSAGSWTKLKSICDFIRHEYNSVTLNSPVYIICTYLFFTYLSLFDSLFATYLAFDVALCTLPAVILFCILLHAFHFPACSLLLVPLGDGGNFENDV